jgi:hypothetical protein
MASLLKLASSSGCHQQLRQGHRQHSARRLPNAESRGSTRFKGAGAHSRAVALRVTDL